MLGVMYSSLIFIHIPFQGIIIDIFSYPMILSPITNNMIVIITLPELILSIIFRNTQTLLINIIINSRNYCRFKPAHKRRYRFGPAIWYRRTAVRPLFFLFAFSESFTFVHANDFTLNSNVIHQHNFIDLRTFNWVLNLDFSLLEGNTVPKQTDQDKFMARTLNH